MKDKLKKLYFLYFFYELYEKYIIYKNKNKSKILIHQMGKVGSSTVYETIKKLNLEYATYHIHWLSQDGILKAEKYFLNTESKKIPMHLRRSKLLNKSIDFSNEKLKIITIAREPIGRIISDFFQNIRYYNPSLINNDDLNNTEVIELISNKFYKLNSSNDYTLNWFDDEFYNSYGVNIYDYPFDKEKGYSIIKKNNIEILILQMESLNSILKDTLESFLELDKNIEIINTNIGEQKEFSENQDFLKTNFKIDKTILESILNSKYFNHFYNDKIKNNIINKWSDSK